MLLEDVERLKKKYTDQYVVADASQPELRRFKGLTGRIVTVNMSGHALVQFDHPVDISWYDIDLSYLTLVEKPQPKPAADKHAKPPAKSNDDKPADTKPAAPKPAGKSPLEMARAQGAAKAAGEAPAAEPADKPLSKLELARMQAAAAKGGAAPAPVTAEGKPMSKLEQARAEAAAKKAATAAPAAPAAAAETSVVVEPKPAPAAPSASTEGLSKLELARRQGAAKK